MRDARSEVHIVPVQEIYNHVATWTHPEHTKIVCVEANVPVSDLLERGCVDAGLEVVRVGIGYAPVDLAVVCATPIAVTFKRKVIVVHEYDAIAASDVSMAAQVHHAAKANTVPMLIVGTEIKLSLKNIHRVVVDSGVPKTVTVEKGVDGAAAALAGHVADFGGDNIAFGGVYDNYLQNAPSIDDCATISEAFSVSECVSESLCRAGVYSDPYTFLPIRTAAGIFADMKAGGSKLKAQVKTFGQVWSKTNSFFAKSTVLRKVCHVLSVNTGDGSMGHLHSVMQLFAAAVRANDYDKAAEIAQSVGFTAPDVVLMMRLSRQTYPATIHAKVKKAMDTDTDTDTDK